MKRGRRFTMSIFMLIFILLNIQKNKVNKNEYANSVACRDVIA
jgi:hypothetical protein